MAKRSLLNYLKQFLGRRGKILNEESSSIEIDSEIGAINQSKIDEKNNADEKLFKERSVHKQDKLQLDIIIANGKLVSEENKGNESVQNKNIDKFH